MNSGRRILGNEYWGHPNICRGHDGRFYSVPPEARHGSMIPLQQPEYDALLATYGTP